MVVDNKNIKEESNHVKFISYSGQYPNLCRGVLILEINGIKCRFGIDYSDPNWREHKNFDSFWSSGGECGFYNDYSESYINYGEWQINYNELPDEYKKYAEEIDRVFNENVPFGCCGGCL